MQKNRNLLLDQNEGIIGRKCAKIHIIIFVLIF